MTHQVLLGAPYSGQTPSKSTTKPTAEVRHHPVTSPAAATKAELLQVKHKLRYPQTAGG